MNIPGTFPRSPTGAVFPTSRAYGCLAAIYLVLAVYGSLVPFKFQSISWDQALVQAQQLRLHSLKILSRTDFVANILLFIPLAFLAMGAACVDRPRVVAVWVGAAVAPVCAGLSAGIEFLQIFCPPRTPSASDIVAESLGAGVGVALWLAAGQRITGWVRQIAASQPGRDLARLLLPGYVVFLVLINVLPLDLTLSPVEIYRKYRDGKVALVPFASFAGQVGVLLEKALWNLVCFFPAGVLLALLPAVTGHNPSHWRRAWLCGLGLAAFIELLQLFVMTRFFDVTDILVGSLGVLAGWAAVRGYRRLQARSSPWLRILDDARSWRLILVGWLALVVFFTWRPFDFDFDRRLAAERWHRISLVPFADYWQGTEYNAFDQFLHKLLLYMPLGVLLAWWTRFARRTRAGLLTAMTGLSCACIMEAGQLFLPGRQPSLTDILVEALGSWAGYHVGRRWQQLQFAGRRDSGKSIVGR